MNPIPRDLRFDAPAELTGVWSTNGAHYAHWFNALSLLFPDGERFFIHSVRQYTDRYDVPPELKTQVDGFIRQEAYHAREHTRHNRMQAQNVAAKATARFHEGIERIQRRLSPETKLGLTIAAEHWTASLADVFMRFPELSATRAGAEPIGRMLLWHAIEESEHKAVAFDVYTRFVGSGLRAYLIRMLTYVGASMCLWGLQNLFFFRLIREAGLLANLRGWMQLARVLLWSPGFLPRLLPLLLDYLRPGFHPWQHDNRKILEQMQATAAAW